MLTVNRMLVTENRKGVNSKQNVGNGKQKGVNSEQNVGNGKQKKERWYQKTETWYQ